jgi:nucleoside 2-deoxyribosyltransferase
MEGISIKIYLAGPLGFSEAGRAFHEQRIIPTLEALGHQILDPWADQGDVAAVLKLPLGAERRDEWQRINPEIGRKNQRLIDECDMIFAVLDGADVDSGTAAEIGYGFAKHKPVLGYRGDFRLSADNEGGIVNLQVEYFIRASGGDIIGQISDLPSALEKLTARTQT